MQAEAIGNAAEEISPGTLIALVVIFEKPLTEIILLNPFLLTFILAPKDSNIFSVWSLVASFSVMLVVPFTFRPASKIADFTCAEGILRMWLIGIGSLDPITCIGSLQS